MKRAAYLLIFPWKGGRGMTSADLSIVGDWLYLNTDEVTKE